MSSASLTTCALVRIRPLAVTITPEPLLIALRSPGSPKPGENGLEKNGSNTAGPASTACDVEMFTTLSTTRSATSGIEPSVRTAGVACAALGPERRAAPAPISPTTAAAARKLRNGVIWVSSMTTSARGAWSPCWGTVVTNVGPGNGLPLFHGPTTPIRQGNAHRHQHFRTRSAELACDTARHRRGTRGQARTLERDAPSGATTHRVPRTVAGREAVNYVRRAPRRRCGARRESSQRRSLSGDSVVVRTSDALARMHHAPA